MLYTTTLAWCLDIYPGRDDGPSILIGGATYLGLSYYKINESNPMMTQATALTR